MLKTCNVYGEVYTPDGVLARNCIVRFIVAHRKVSAQDDKTIVPRAVIAATDGAGLLSWVDEAGEVRDFVLLAPGGYEARLFTQEGEPFAPVNLGVPDEASVAFSAIIDLPPPISIVSGPKGDPGADGLSAYEIELDNGFEGDEEEWLASLVGPAGPKGDAGAIGPAGPKGDPGAIGAAGPKGDPGADGSDGLDGAPGQSVSIVVFQSQVDFDSYTPAPNEIVVLTDA
ncbi:MAG: hypothetical protein Q4G49_04170 [Paracoccus sp. (in: a-proteobacteria)]|nr:hypothetical protein [Paracoccus sp. (in: a-proteobacteria)]